MNSSAWNFWIAASVGLLFGCGDSNTTSGPGEDDSSSSLAPIDSSSSSAAQLSSSALALSSSSELPFSSSLSISSSSTAAVPSSSSEASTNNTQACLYSSGNPKGTLVCSEKTYATVVVGTQTWMAENLAWLPRVNPGTDNSSSEPRYYVYDFSGSSAESAVAENNYTTYGVLYNWTAALSACPMGWHLPSDSEWTVLTDLLGFNTAGTQLKANSSLWKTNTGTDDYGFAALPGGYYDGGVFYSVGFYGLDSLGDWWTSTMDQSSYTHYRTMTGSRAWVLSNEYDFRNYGFSVRCLQDPS